MSTLPVLPLPTGVSWDSKKSPRFSTVTQYPVSGARPVSFSTAPLPSWEWELAWEILRDQELEEENSSSLLKPDFFMIQDFFLAMNGANGRFIYDPAANVIPIEDTFITQTTAGTLVNGYSGTTDGAQNIFQMYRSSKASGQLIPAEAIDALSAVSSPFQPYEFKVYLDETLVSGTDYTFAQYPLQVTFTSPPTAGQVLSWTGKYAYVAKFLDDRIDLNQFMQNLWDLQSLKLEQVPLGF